MKIRHGADTLVELVAPIDQGATPTAPLATATVSAVLLDTAGDTALDAHEAAGQTVISVESVRRIVQGDTVRIEQGSAGVHASGVSSVDIAGGTITLASGLSLAASKGSRVSVQVGPTLSLAGFNLGNANVETTDWGYRGEISSNHSGLENVSTVRVEITATQGGRVAREWFDVAVERPGA